MQIRQFSIPPRAYASVLYQMTFYNTVSLENTTSVIFSIFQKPDYITVGGSSNKKTVPILANDAPGTFTFDDETNTLRHIITGKGITESTELPMDLVVYKCYFENCTDPHPQPLPSNPTLLEKETATVKICR